MAKRYIITEEQFKAVLGQLSLNESEMANEDFGMDTGEGDRRYALVDVKLEEHLGQQALACFFEEEGSKRIFKGTVDMDDMVNAGLNPEQVLAKYQETQTIPDTLEDLAYKNAEYLHDGEYDSFE